jgi:alkanesulfonate monooxygenase SsuD/methylene tetrahydromethanopterin reductase-like flavin-dependent oxidoreductase (luciferase family)
VKVGILGIFQNYQGRTDDAAHVQDELRLAELTEPLGFDSYWPPEHHFTDYSACPDNLQVLSWLAGRTTRIGLGTGAVIVPWNDPLRVAEKVAMLDHLSNGRAILGLGRGLSRHEYGHFGIDMNEARDRFDEGSRMILDALETGDIEGAGPYYPQRKTPIRPRPPRSFRDRFYCVGLSPESVEQAARLGATLMTFTQMPWEMYASGPLADYRKAFQTHQRREAPWPLTGDLMFCDASAERAETMAREYMANYFLSIVNHYELMSEHFGKTKGYELYANAADAFRAAGMEPAMNVYISIQTWGTPLQILERLEARKRLLGGFEMLVLARYGGMSLADAEGSLRLFASKVLPEVQAW